MSAPVLDEVGDGDQPDPVPRAIRDEVGHARHRPVVVHHLADDAGRVSGRRAARGRPQPRSGPSARARRRRLARSGNTCPGWTRSAAPLDGSIATWIVCERSCAEMPVVTPSRASIEIVKAVSERRLVVLGHRPQTELVAALLREAEADQAACMRGHEVDRFRRRELRCDDEVALILAVRVVDDDHEPALANVLDRLVDRREHARSRCSSKVMVLRSLRAAARRTWRARRPRG